MHEDLLKIINEVVPSATARRLFLQVKGNEDGNSVLKSHFQLPLFEALHLEPPEPSSYVAWLPKELMEYLARLTDSEAPQTARVEELRKQNCHVAP